MQPPRDETLRTLLGDLYPNDSSGDGQELSSQLLQILSDASGDGDMAEDAPVSYTHIRAHET